MTQEDQEATQRAFHSQRDINVFERRAGAGKQEKYIWLLLVNVVSMCIVSILLVINIAATNHTRDIVKMRSDELIRMGNLQNISMQQYLDKKIDLLQCHKNKNETAFIAPK